VDRQAAPELSNRNATEGSGAREKGRWQHIRKGENVMKSAVKFVVTGLAGCMLAAMPFAVTDLRADPPASQSGKWRFNAAESNQGANPNPVTEATLDVPRDDGNHLQFHLVETLKNGAKNEVKWDGAYDGKPRSGSDVYMVGYTHTSSGWSDKWEMTGGPAKGIKGFDECSLSADGKKQTCRGGVDGSAPSYTLVYDKVAP
jgi:hypothetical protein